MEIYFLLYDDQCAIKLDLVKIYISKKKKKGKAKR